MAIKVIPLGEFWNFEANLIKMEFFEYFIISSYNDDFLQNFIFFAIFTYYDFSTISVVWILLYCRLKMIQQHYFYKSLKTENNQLILTMNRRKYIGLLFDNILALPFHSQHFPGRILKSPLKSRVEALLIKFPHSQIHKDREQSLAKTRSRHDNYSGILCLFIVSTC